MQEFKQYGHYMQPRIHKMIQEVRYYRLNRNCRKLVPHSCCLGYLFLLTVWGRNLSVLLSGGLQGLP